MPPNNTTLAQFSTNSFTGNPLRLIGYATATGMGLMMIGIMAGVPVFIAAFLLIAGILLVYGYTIGKVQYSLYEDGIEQRIRKFIPYYLSKKEETRFLDWPQIKSYKNDVEMTRGLQQYEYIKLYLDRSPGQVWITDQHDKAGFQAFKVAFLIKMQGFAPKTEQDYSGFSTNTTVTSADKPQVATPSEPRSKPIEIKRRRSFYASFFAKIITVFFILLCLLLLWIGLADGLSGGAWFRLVAIILPGTLYMYYRVFMRGENGSE